MLHAQAQREPHPALTLRLDYSAFWTLVRDRRPGASPTGKRYMTDANQ